MFAKGDANIINLLPRAVSHYDPSESLKIWSGVVVELLLYY